VFDPVSSAIGDRRRLWMSPDDRLATLPFETLPGALADSFLIETHAIAYIQNARDLCRAPLVVESPAMLAFGDIDYGEGGGGPVKNRGMPYPFAELPGSKAELDAIASACGAVPRITVRRADASEAALRERIAGVAYVHLATHGFYGDAQADGQIAAGIALAFANQHDGANDGILTALEAQLLDCRQCRLVVLSACQSGLGRPFAGESLLGLRRALHIAGARATVTTLWRIDDAETALLMADFYRELFATRCEPSDALRQAQLRALARARARTGEGLPGIWGAFVCEGAR
jgi:CHAT domain-containing protein